MAKCSSDNSRDGKSLTKRLKDAGIEAAAATFLQLLKVENPHYPFKMLLIGEIGSGKTSFLNLLYNCATVQALGCGFGNEGLEYFRQFNHIKLENTQSISDPMESKTNAATLYNVEVGELKVGIIDTPGFGDSRGLKQDEINVKRIIEVLEKEEYINCVCLIINGRQARASASLQYVLTEITAILPREIFQNVIIIFSNTNDPLDLNFDPNQLTEYFGRPVSQGLIFFIENPYCRFEKAKIKIAQLGIKRVASSLQKSFDDTAKVLTKICQKIKDFPQVHTHHFITLYEMKQAIEGNILQMVTEYDNQVEIEKAIKKTKEEVDAAVNSKILNKDFRSTQRFSRWIVVKTDYHNTLCGYAGCHKNCHEACSLPKSLDNETFKFCWCMHVRGGNSTCQICGHYYTFHYHEKSLYKEIQEVEDLVDKKMKSKFEKTESDQEQAEMLYAKLENKKQSCRKERLRLFYELLHKIKEFEDLGVARNYVKLIKNQLAVIETRLKGTTGSESEYLRKAQEELKKKLVLIRGAQPEDDQRDNKPFVHEEKPFALLPGVKTELKEEPPGPTLEGKPHALISMKREIKEDAGPMTKAETTSVQPITASWNLCGVEVCGERTVVIHSSHGRQIAWPGYGLRLNIPKGCLPADMEQCTINIKASLAGQYEFPKNSHLVSAIFWLRCEDVHKFTKPITVEIQHCAKSDNVSNLKLSFIRAVCSQKQLPYTFKQLPGGNFTSYSSYGVIELNTFSGVGVTQEGSEDREYCSQLFYLGQPNPCIIHFVVSWNVEAHLTEVIKKYKEEGAILGVHQPIEFEADAISLDIPMEGLSIKGWEITPLMRPVVTKKQVDNFREGKLTPCCQLLAEVSEKKKKVPTQVNLRGAKYPNNVFVINFPAGNPNSQSTGTLGDLATADCQGPPPSKKSRLDASEPSASGASTAGPSSGISLDTKLGVKPELKDLLKELYTKASDWINIGVFLDIDPGRLDNIKAENHTVQDYLREMLRIWLKGVSPPPSWAAIAEAIELLGDQTLADQLRTKYHVPPHQN